MVGDACRINSIGQVICTNGTSGDSIDTGTLGAMLGQMGASDAKAALILSLIKVVMASGLSNQEIINRTADIAATVELCLDPSGFPDVIYKNFPTALRYAPLRLAADQEWGKLCNLLRGIGVTC